MSECLRRFVFQRGNRLAGVAEALRPSEGAVESQDELAQHGLSVCCSTSRLRVRMLLVLPSDGWVQD